jgi:hypothetical protein
MRVPKASKGGFSGQMNNAAKDVKSNMGRGQPSQSNRGMPVVQERVSNRLNGQPNGKARCGMDDKLLNRLKTSKRGI